MQVFYHGFHGDTSATFLVGNVDPAAQKLVDVARKCRDAGVAICRPGALLNEIGQVIRQAVIELNFSCFVFVLEVLKRLQAGWLGNRWLVGTNLLCAYPLILVNGKKL